VAALGRLIYVKVEQAVVCFEWVGPRTKIPNCVMYSFFKIFIVVLFALALIDWLAAERRADTNIPNATPGLSFLPSDNNYESPKRNVPPGLLPGDIKYESPNGNVRIYFPIVTSIVLSVLFTLILRLISRSGNERVTGDRRGV
jgi:Protein of unknown function (DUF2905)